MVLKRLDEAQHFVTYFFSIIEDKYKDLSLLNLCLFQSLSPFLISLSQISG